ncbi:hypothetical protein [Rhodococcus sp. PSBB049]|uniref:hypothetical protein n=1 Tax=Rhodococcus sp. PSBB049 TaxID=2812863 RepID=UPI00198076F4|nr:hypothetical protein [Rhodococcus sp. PSBB049]QSE72194.1 hypothetical protein JYA91_27875 [Rhodococcus sp. PSBB049]
MTALTAAAERLTALLAAARAGQPVTPEELAQASAEASAEQEINTLIETGKAERAKEKAERQRLADQATALATAREVIREALDRAHIAWDALDQLKAEAEAANAQYNDAIATAYNALKDSGIPGIQVSGGSWRIDDYEREVPGFDARNHWDRYGSRGAHVVLDGTQYAPAEWDPRTRPAFPPKP